MVNDLWTIRTDMPGAVIPITSVVPDDETKTWAITFRNVSWLNLIKNKRMVNRLKKKPGFIKMILCPSSQLTVKELQS